MLKIALGLAILASLAGLGLSFKVQEKITAITEQRDGFEKEKNEALAAESSAKSAAKKAKEEEEKTKKELTTTKEALVKAATEADAQTRRARSLDDQLVKTIAEKTEAQQQLSAWNATGYTPEQIKGLKGELTKATEAIEAGNEERKVLARNNSILNKELSRYRGEDDKVVLPAGLKGKVAVVDRKNDFVVIDIGSTQGALTNGEMLVNRGGRLVAKVRLTTVEANRSIANVLPEFKQAEIIEGDIVLR